MTARACACGCGRAFDYKGGKSWRRKYYEVACGREFRKRLKSGLGLCRLCSKPAARGSATCRYHHGRDLQYTARVAASGVCIRCHQRPARPQRQMCEGCVKDVSLSNARRFAFLASAGLCQRCKAVLTNGLLHCDSCLKAKKVRARIYWVSRGSERMKKKRARKRAEREYHRERYRRRKGEQVD